MSQPARAGKAPSLTELPQWRALQRHFSEIGHRHLRDLFSADPARGERLVAEAAGWYFDYSKNRVSGDTITLLLSLAEACSLRERIEAMFRGDKINVTEQRAVLHVSLRALRSASFLIDGSDGVADVETV